MDKELITPILVSKDNNPRDFEHSNSPFFILGCVRSGTTLLRDLLRLHPRLECPEETHFFRWPDPYASPRFMHPYTKNKIIMKQRGMDGISEEEFAQLIRTSYSRKELAEGYGQLYLEKQGNSHGRWFDKTPQNIYGILLISQMIPDARFIHIYRNPLNVTASLLLGEVLSSDGIVDAINYWYEPMAIMQQYKQIAQERVIEISYEDLTTEPQSTLGAILKFVGENVDELILPRDMVHPERNKYMEVLTEEQVKDVKQYCMPYYREYGYS